MDLSPDMPGCLIPVKNFSKIRNYALVLCMDILTAGCIFEG